MRRIESPRLLNAESGVSAKLTFTRDAMHNADYVCPFVCPYVRLSVTCRRCVKMAKYILELFSLSGSHTFLVFYTPNVMAIFQQKPPLTGRRMEGV